MLASSFQSMRSCSASNLLVMLIRGFFTSVTCMLSRHRWPSSIVIRTAFSLFGSASRSRFRRCAGPLRTCPGGEGPDVRENAVGHRILRSVRVDVDPSALPLRSQTVHAFHQVELGPNYSFRSSVLGGTVAVPPLFLEGAVAAPSLFHDFRSSRLGGSEPGLNSTAPSSRGSSVSGSGRPPVA